MDASLQEARASFLSGLVPGNLSKVIASPGLPPGLVDLALLTVSALLVSPGF